jgi:hypothetical protein
MCLVRACSYYAQRGTLSARVTPGCFPFPLCRQPWVAYIHANVRRWEWSLSSEDIITRTIKEWFVSPDHSTGIKAVLYDCDTLTAQSKSRVDTARGAAQPCKPRMVLWSTGTLPIHMAAIKIVTSCSGTQCHPSSLYAKHAIPNETPHFQCSLPLLTYEPVHLRRRLPMH